MLKRRLLFVLPLLAALSAPASALAQAGAASAVTPPRTSRYLEGSPLLFAALVPAPPASGSNEEATDLATLLRVQASRTPAQIKDGQRDDKEESMFAFATVLGPRFAEADLPLTAALSKHLREESAVVNPELKLAFHRPRPFVAHAGVMPVCPRTASDSYPSGHAMVGYLEGFALAQMIPEKSGALVERAGDFAHNRVVCGVHYPTDVDASRTLAAALFGALETSPRFQQELAAARVEVRKRLALQP